MERAQAAKLGSGFACLQTTGGVTCVGDDRFGQRGGSALSPAQPLAVGTWHACALAVPFGLRSGYAACWGRDDVGQLGTPGTATCAADGRMVPCARQPVHGPAVGTADGLATLAAGDLFTCLGTSDGIRCWGANRDGFFGTPDACPGPLRNDWPTGSVAAPRAACAPDPVTLPGLAGGLSWLAAGPRGLCFDGDSNQARCLGAIPTPSGRDITYPKPSPGNDAAACGISGHRVVCWGEGYSPGTAPDQPAEVVFPPLVSRPEAAELDLRREPNRGPAAEPSCQTPVAPLPACAPGSAAGAPAWSDLATGAAALVGQTIRVRGALAVSDVVVPVGVGRLVTAPAVIAGVSPLVFGDFGDRGYEYGCRGYGGALRCDVPAFGQTVVATGRLAAGVASTSGSPWTLVEASVCEERTAR